MSNDCGTIHHKRQPATRDADVVRAVRAAGAVIIAVTNTPQLCMNWETYNNVTGLTMNPYDQRLTTGGSSGGEVAIIAFMGYLLESIIQNPQHISSTFICKTINPLHLF